MTETVTVQVGDKLIFDIDVPDEQEFAQWLYATVVQKYPTRARGGYAGRGSLFPTWVDEDGYRKPPAVWCGGLGSTPSRKWVNGALYDPITGSYTIPSGKKYSSDGIYLVSELEDKS